MEKNLKTMESLLGEETKNSKEKERFGAEYEKNSVRGNLYKVL